MIEIFLLFISTLNIQFLKTKYIEKNVENERKMKNERV